MDFDTALLRTYVAVKEAGGFTRAAERLHLSQSAVSHQIRRLEAQAGTALLVRTTRSLALTEDGEDFLRYAEQVLRAQDALARRFQRSSVAGAVRLGVPENFMGERLPLLLARFAPFRRCAWTWWSAATSTCAPRSRRICWIWRW
ncbi:LysR family transcriptional regulator [Achromobacter xylosoxidans]